MSGVCISFQKGNQMSSLDKRLTEAHAPSLEALLHTSGVQLPDQAAARRIMADARIGIATIARWRRPPVRFLHQNFARCVFAGIVLVGLPFLLKDWSLLALSCAVVGAFILNARGYKRTLEWRVHSYETFVRYERNYMPHRVREIAETVKQIKPATNLQVWTLAQDPVLVIRDGNDTHLLAGWDGDTDLF